MTTLLDQPKPLAGASLAELLDQVEQGQRAQQRELEAIGEQLDHAREAGAHPDLPVHTLDALLGCLTQTSRAHRGTTKHLSVRLTALARGDRASVTGEDLGLAHLLRRTRLEHESLLGLLDFADCTTAHFTCPAAAPAQHRELYAALASWARRERARIRVEFDELVPHAIELAPGLSEEGQRVELPIHRREILAGGGHRSEATVFCPAERESVGVDWCRGCPLLVRVGKDVVECTPHDMAPSRDGARARLGVDILVGEAMGEHHVTALPEAPAVDVARALASERGRPALVVDDGGRLLSVVDAETAAASPRRLPVGALGHLVATVHESTSLADALDCMVRKHRRFLPVVRDDDRVVGVLADVDALRSIARRRTDR
jgi:CBS domain-containing protein